LVSKLSVPLSCGPGVTNSLKDLEDGINKANDLI
jgi:hypothetical protein